MPLHVAQFVHRYPPALGGAEAYTARLCEHLASRGDAVTVWTTTAVELNELWNASASLRSASRLNGVEVRRYRPVSFPLRRYVLKALSFIPHRPWQAAFQPVNPICPAMWTDANTYDGPLDAVHATAFPYAFPILCARRLAMRRRVPFLLTPFLHLGDPTNPRDRTRRQYTRPHLRWLLTEADTVFVQTPSEREAVLALGVPADRVVMQGLGVDPAECTCGDRTAARAIWGVGECPGGESPPHPSRLRRADLPLRGGGEEGSHPSATPSDLPHPPPPRRGRSSGREAARRVGGHGEAPIPAVVIGHLANLSAEKGSVDLIHAASGIGPHLLVLAGPAMPSFKVLALPDAPSMGMWERRLPYQENARPEDLGDDFGRTGERTFVPGVLTDPQKRDFFAGIDIFALPSRTDSFGLVLLEAWANGKPVVVYRAGGPADLVRHGVDGLVAKCGDVADLREQLRALVENAELRTRLGEAGRARVAEEFRWEPKLALVRERMVRRPATG